MSNRHPELKLYMGDHHGPRGDMYRADEVDALLSRLAPRPGTISVPVETWEKVVGALEYYAIMSWDGARASEALHLAAQVKL